MKNVIRALIFLLVMVNSFNVYAWNEVGHMVVATIAYNQLQPAVRTKVDKMAANLQKEYPNVTSFVLMAPWPDSLRDQSIEIFTDWHYIDTPFSGDGTPVKNPPDTDNVVWAINLIEPVFKDKNANAFEQARFLAFLVHFVGDIHQPLHVATRVTAQYPDGDEGGNLYPIQYQMKSSQATDLHSLWDAGVGVFDTDTSPEVINQLANTITSLYPQSYFGTLVNDLKPEDWASECYKLAMSTAYNTPVNKTPSSSYITTGQQTAEQRVALAGYRLAALLNQLLADNS